jgi:peroxiredoxin
LKIMYRVTADQRASGFQASMPKPGHPAPAFMLANQDGTDVSSAALVARGPLVVSFFRGRW